MDRTDTGHGSKLYAVSNIANSPQLTVDHKTCMAGSLWSTSEDNGFYSGGNFLPASAEEGRDSNVAAESFKPHRNAMGSRSLDWRLGGSAYYPSRDHRTSQLCVEEAVDQEQNLHLQLPFAEGKLFLTL